MTEQADVPSGKPRKDWDRITAVAAMLIGLVAVAVAAYTALLQREQIRAQVWPRVLLYNAGSAGEFRISNKGVGPAVIRAVQVSVDGKPVRDWAEALDRLELSDPVQRYSSLAGMVLAPGEDVPYLQPGGADRFDALRPHMGERVKLVVCYCSALDDCWAVRNHGETMDDVHQPVGHCPSAGPADFQN